jgi:hypothetical protein
MDKEETRIMTSIENSLDTLRGDMTTVKADVGAIKIKVATMGEHIHDPIDCPAVKGHEEASKARTSLVIKVIGSVILVTGFVIGIIKWIVPMAIAAANGGP